MIDTEAMREKNLTLGETVLLDEIYRLWAEVNALRGGEPSDDEILSLAYDVGAMPEQMTDAGLFRFARALLARYGQPAPDVAGLVEALELARNDLKEWLKSFPNASREPTGKIIERIDAAQQQEGTANG